MIRAALILCAALGTTAAAASPEVAIEAFNRWCFKAGQTARDARMRMERDAGTPLPFTLTFWDRTLEPGPADAPRIERRCDVRFDGDHTAMAIVALRAQMATPPVFGFAIALPKTHSEVTGAALIEGRELLRGRVAVVHVGTVGAGADIQTFMRVDRLPRALGDS